MKNEIKFKFRLKAQHHIEKPPTDSWQVLKGKELIYIEVWLWMKILYLHIY